MTDATVIGLTIFDNTIDHSGIGISFDRATVVGMTVERNVITNNNAGLSFFSGSYSAVTVDKCYFEGNAWEHIDLGAWGKNPTLSDYNITGCQFLSGPWCGIYIESTFNPTDIEINYNNFLVGGPSYFGVCNTTDNIVNAENNWWGSERGPSRAMGKAKGHDEVKGDRVSPNVRFAPWLKNLVTL